MGVLAGVRVVEIAGIGPGPFCGMLLADLGADVVVVERPSKHAGAPRPHDVVQRGKRSIVLDLKQPSSVEVVLGLVERSDALIEGMRPGVMDRLGLGPDVCLARRPSLVYGRLTGWGQTGPMSQAAGHDGNYIGLSGALWYASPAGTAPVAPPTLVGDIAGGALYLAVGLLAGILRARTTGQGQVVDAAIVDGSAHMLNLILGALRGSSYARGTHFIDGAPWNNTYRCADGAWVTIASLEPQFYAEFLRRAGLDGDPRLESQHDAAAWPAQRAVLSEAFARRTQREWCAILEGTDACFAPVNDPAAAAVHPHMAARGTYAEIDGTLQARPAPRFSRDDPAQWPRAIPVPGEHTEAVLGELGMAR